MGAGRPLRCFLGRDLLAARPLPAPARWSWRTEWLDLLRAILLFAFFAFAFLYVAKLPNVSRLFLLETFRGPGRSSLVGHGASCGAASRGPDGTAGIPLRPGRGVRCRRHDFARMIDDNAYLWTPDRWIPRGPESGRSTTWGDSSGERAPRRVAVPALRLPSVASTRSRSPALGCVVDEGGHLPALEHAVFVEPVARLCEEEGLVVRILSVDRATAIPGGRRGFRRDAPPVARLRP